MRVPPRSNALKLVRVLIPEKDPPALARYGWAAVTLLAAVALGALVHPYAVGPIFVTVFPAVAIASVLWGPGPAAVVAAAGGVAAIFLWMTPEVAWPASTDGITNLVVFWLMCVPIVLTGYWVRLLVTELRGAEREALLRAGETRHRLQNLFALILSIGRSAQRSTASVNELWRTLEQRITALSAAQDLIVDPEQGSNVRDLLARILAGHDPARFSMHGPDCIVRTSTALVLGIHELATNAAKYGALSAAQGHIEIEWHCADGVLEIVWTEMDGPAVQPSSRRGFGTSILKSLDADVEFREAGLRCSFRVTGASIGSETAPSGDAQEHREEDGVLHLQTRTLDFRRLVVERTPQGHHVARIGRRWLPGLYATERAARLACRLPDRVLRSLAGDGMGTEALPTSPLTVEQIEQARSRWLKGEA